MTGTALGERRRFEGHASDGAAVRRGQLRREGMKE
jgi:hypothetical protein